MDGGPGDAHFALAARSLGRLMPMHLCLSTTGHITACGPTLTKLAPDQRFVGKRLFEMFEIRRPGGITSLAALRQRFGQRLYLNLRDHSGPGLRGIAVPLNNAQGILLNLSFGISIIDAVRDHALTDADFAATDLAVELLYLVEAKSAVMEELRQLNLRLQGAKLAAEKQALTDVLTGLHNRRALDMELGRLIGAQIPFGLMHIDLDYFKTVNDTLGHAAGDHVLRVVARVLTEETRIMDTQARVGGDEFVVVLPDLAEPIALNQIARRIIAKLNQPTDFEGKTCRVSASIGLAISTDYPSLMADQILNDADQALYASKHAGRGQVTLSTTRARGMRKHDIDEK